MKDNNSEVYLVKLENVQPVKLIKLGYTTKWSLEAGLSKYWEGAQRREASRN